MIRPALAILAITAAAGYAQPGGLEPSFEVASVRLSGPESNRGSNGGPGTRDPERFTFNRADLRDLIFRAYGLEDYQAQIAGPSWIDTESYDLAVKIPVGTSKEQFQAMLRNLLRDRFQLKVHHESKVLAIYTLEIAKGGPKLKPSVIDLLAARSTSSALTTDKDGFPELPAGGPTWIMMNRPGRSTLAARQQPVSVLPTILRTFAKRPVVDKTQLSGAYDFRLEFNPQADVGGTDANGQDGSVPDLFIAIQQQLGLRLAEGKAPFDVIVLDDARRVPSEN